MKVDLTNGRVSTVIPKIKPPGRILGNWLRAYLEYTDDNEAPPEYHMWIALGTIAGATQRKIMMRATYFDVLTNLYILLVSPPGKSRKTTALKIGQSILKHVPGVHFTTKAGSPAALIKQFAELPNKEHQSLTGYAYEFGTMMSSSPAEMVDLITDLYDGNPDWDKQTIARGMEKIPRPWFNLMGATTPQWLGDYMSPTAVEGGLVSRTIHVYSDERNLKSAFPEETAWHRDMRKRLINDLTHISTLEGEFHFAPGVFEYYDAWYKDERRFPEMSDNRTSGYYERKHIHVLKVAMALSLCERDDLILTQQDLDTAMEMLQDTEPGLKRSFSSVGRNIYATDLERMLENIRRTGSQGMPYGQILAQNYHAMGKKLIDEQLESLRSMGEVEVAPGNIYKLRNGKHG